MKKAVSYLLACMMMLMLMVVPSYTAYTANLSLSVSASSVHIGDTVTATVSVPSGITATVDVYFSTELFQFVSASGTTNVNGGTIATTLGDPFSSSITITLKAKTAGNTKISASVIQAGDTNNIDESGNAPTIKLGGDSKSVTIKNKTVTESTTQNGSTNTQTAKSADNSLSSLKISAGYLWPSFKYNVTKYYAVVDYEVNKLVVSATPSNKKATIEYVTGNGNVPLKVGDNVIEIVVKAENGVKATYTVTVTRNEKEKTVASEESQDSQIQEESQISEVQQDSQEEQSAFEYNGQKLNIIQKIPNETIPEDFVQETLIVNGKKMTGLRFSKGELQTLYLKNEAGDSSLYVYDENEQTVYPFVKLTSEKNYVIVLRPNNTEVPNGFVPCTLSIEGKGTIEAYRYEGNKTKDTQVTKLIGTETYFASESKSDGFYLLYCITHHTDRAGVGVDIILDGGDASLQILDALLNIGKKQLAVLGQLDISALSDKEFDVQLFLQLLDRVTQVRLADEELLRRAGVMLQLRNGPEVIQLS